MRAVDRLQPPPTPDRAHEPVRAHKGGGIHWFRLIVIALILVRMLTALPGLAWSRLSAPWKFAARQADR